MDELGLNERQKKAVVFLKQTGRISNREYRQQTGANDRTALRDLAELLEKGVLQKVGTTGRAAYYIIGRKQDLNPT